jgi:sigma-B regulation protein RsbU (phosphoserine phosphatase)
MEPLVEIVHDQLIERRSRLVDAAEHAADRASLDALIRDVDAALERVGHGEYGLCERCHGAIEAERLLADPLTRVCLDCLPPHERRALERDLEMAAQIQAGLLPPPEVRHGSWDAAYRYQPARTVSGDYCDIVPAGGGQLHFLLGDVSGKGIAASMVMTQLHAMFRALIPLQLPLAELVGRASRMLCESTLSTQYATLVCGTLDEAGGVSLCNAGHPAALLLCDAGVTRLESTGMPLGMFCTEEYSLACATMAPGDTLLVYTDGVTEASDGQGSEYGLERLLDLAARYRCQPIHGLLDACMADLRAHRGVAPVHDDFTLLAIQRVAQS